MTRVNLVVKAIDLIIDNVGRIGSWCSLLMVMANIARGSYCFMGFKSAQYLSKNR